MIQKGTDMPQEKDDSGLFTIPITEEDEKMPDYIMPDKVYDVLKWVALLVCPALATLISHVGNVWGIPNSDAVAMTIVEIGLFIGACIGVSHISSIVRK